MFVDIGTICGISVSTLDGLHHPPRQILRQERTVNLLKLALCVILVFGALLCHAQVQTAPGVKAEDQVAQLERDWLAADAKGDVASLRHLVADDFIGSSFNGSLLSKQDIIPEAGHPGGFTGATTGETQVRVFGDTAVLLGTINSANASQHTRITLVCQKRGLGWQMIAARMDRAQ
jgi:ketosteroid isomerase-like protein